MSAPSTTRTAAVASTAYSSVDCDVFNTGVTMAQTTTVRVHQHTRQAIAELSAQRGTTAADLLEELVARERDNALLDAMNAHFADLTDEERRALAEEREAWEGTLLDGLTPSP
jgi:methylmalonyl-CoA mutase cobalamin-binding subunit